MQKYRSERITAVINCHDMHVRWNEGASDFHLGHKQLR